MMATHDSGAPSPFPPPRWLGGAVAWGPARPTASTTALTCEPRSTHGAAVDALAAEGHGIGAADHDGHSMAVALAVPQPRLLAVDNERYSALHPNIWEPDVGAASKDSRRQHLRPSSKTGKPYRVYWSER
jgi:hypothetical protein